MPLTFPAFVSNKRVVAAANNSPCMKQGDRDQGVAILQAALIDVGHRMPISTKKNGVPDGIYGKETNATVYQFQSDKKLGKDGIAGRQTFNRLDTLLSASSPKPKPKKKPKNKPGPSPIRSDRNYMIGTADPRITPDVGAGVWNSVSTTVVTMLQKQLILEILPPRGNSALLLVGRDAAIHMLHYMHNSGRDLKIRLEGMIRDVPTAKEHFQNEVNQAKAFVESLPPGTHQITSKNAESAYNFKGESRNWFFAVGGYSTWGKGTAKVSPDGSECEIQFEYKFFDRYNWDGGKEVTIGGITVTDVFMGDFHRQGIAREFNMRGSIERSFRWKKGGAIPSKQYLQPGSR